MREAENASEHFEIDTRDVQGTTNDSVNDYEAATDLSKQKRAEQALKETNRLLEDVFSGTPLLIAYMDRDFNFLRVNRQYALVDNRDPEFFFGKNHFALYPHKENEKIFRKVIETGNPYFEYEKPFEYAGHPERGVTFWDWSLSPVKGPDGNVEGLVLTLLNVTERKQLTTLKREHEFITAVLDTAAALVVVLDTEGRIVFFNKACERLSGYLFDEVKGRFVRDLFLLPEELEAVNATFERLMAGNSPQLGERHWKTRKGGTRLIAWSCTAIGEKNGAIRYIVGTGSDITESRKTEKVLRQSEEQYRYLFEHNPYPMWIYNKETLSFLSVNNAAIHSYGYSREEFLAMTIKDIRPPETVPDLLFVLEKANDVYRTPGIMIHRKKEGALINVEITTHDILFDGEESRMVLAYDVTERKRMEETIKHQAYHDMLTDLPNRVLFMDHLSLALMQAQRSRSRLAVLFMDIDRFKTINDSLGHTAGDRLLKEVAARLRPCVRESDIVARIGGDEFTMLLPQVAHAEDASKIAGKVLAAFQKPFLVEGHELMITPSIGISIYPDDGAHAETLLKNADIAMYHAKAEGRNNYQFYNPVMNVLTLERMILENSLRQTLKRGELVVHYQPQVSIDQGRIVGVEALVRWQHPELGLLNPKRFLPIAEETGFIVSMDEWVLRTACAQNRAWQEAGYPPLRVTVNLSARQFHKPALVELVSQTLHETGLEPQWLELEITEGAAMGEIELTGANLKKLTALGVSCSIDDFGTGYSSLSYLKKLPIQKLKIDKSFIKGITENADDQAIVNAVIAMAHNLKLKVIAEGVENEEQLMFLRASGCDEIQGYLFSEALPAEGVKELIELYK